MFEMCYNRSGARNTRQPTLVIMARAPVAGRTKTRLGREIGMVPAAWWARHQLFRLTRTLADPRWEIVLAVTPDSAVTSAALPPGTRVSQGRGTLGDRMARVFRLFPGPTLIVGADIPDLTRRGIRAGFAALGSHDAVIGPAPDGGYWAIGLKHTHPLPPRLFDNVRWSTAHARADTLATLGDCSVAFLPTLHDVDTAADLKRVFP